MDAEDKRLSFNIGNVNIKQLVILGIVIILIAIFLIFMFKDNKYKKLEESMLATAKNYLKVNNLNVSAEQFLTIKQMGIVNLEGCNEASGVKITLSNNGLKYEPYLICNNYMSKNITTEKGQYIELLGDNPYIVTGNTVFTEPGYKSNGYTVDRVSNYKASPGIYQITYYVYDNGITSTTEFYTIHETDLTESEIREYLTYKQLSLIRTIKNCVMFFTVLTIIGMIAYFLIMMNAFCPRSRNATIYMPKL